jgi:hypothetical protein
MALITPSCSPYESMMSHSFRARRADDLDAGESESSFLQIASRSFTREDPFPTPRTATEAATFAAASYWQELSTHRVAPAQQSPSTEQSPPAPTHAQLSQGQHARVTHGPPRQSAAVAHMASRGPVQHTPLTTETQPVQQPPFG